MFRELMFAWWKWGVARDVRRRGWRGIYVGEYQGPEVAWAYSVGFWEHAGGPDIVVFDVPPDAANELLWNAFSELKRGDLVIEDGAPWPGFDVSPVWRRVHPNHIDADDGWFTFARWYRAHRTGQHDLEVFQLVLPDAAHVFPWEDGYDETLRSLQPELYLPAVVAE